MPLNPDVGNFHFQLTSNESWSEDLCYLGAQLKGCPAKKQNFVKDEEMS